MFQCCHKNNKDPEPQVSNKFCEFHTRPTPVLESQHHHTTRDLKEQMLKVQKEFRQLPQHNFVFMDTM